MAGIFISYRRSDSAAMCDRIYAALVQRFGKDTLFKDVDSIPLGVNFADYLRGVLAQSAVFVLIIGRSWLDVDDGQGGRRLDDPTDYVRLELEAALAQRIPIVPLLVDGARLPTADRLPESLRGLPQQNGWEIHYDPYFETDIRHVTAALERWVRPLQAPPPLPRAPTSPKPTMSFPWGRVLAYGGGFGAAGAVVFTFLYAVGAFASSALTATEMANTLVSNAILAGFVLIGAIPAFLIRYRSSHFWAGLLAAMLANVLLYAVAGIEYGLTNHVDISATLFASVLLAVIFGPLVGVLTGALGAGSAMLWLRMRPKRPRVVVNGQTATLPPK
jgi:hypothetical protein